MAVTRKPLKPTFFKTPAEFRAWLKKHHKTAREIVVGYYRKSSGKPSMTWQESVDEALCFGWIDGIRRKYGDDAYGNRFTPRRPGSNWSAININRVEELKKLGKMQPAGLAAYERRRAAKSRVYTYEQKSREPFAPAIEKKFRASRKAWQFFEKQPPYYRKLMFGWINGAKAEATQFRRLQKLIDACEQGKRVM